MHLWESHHSALVRLPRGAAALGSPTLLLGTPHPCSVRKPDKLIISTTWSLVDDALDCNWYPVKKGRYTCSHRPKEYWTRDMDQLKKQKGPFVPRPCCTPASSKIWKPKPSSIGKVSLREDQRCSPGEQGRKARKPFLHRAPRIL